MKEILYPPAMHGFMGRVDEMWNGAGKGGYPASWSTPAPERR
jgi:hypothetical protein